jgi:hypothetical protein
VFECIQSGGLGSKFGIEQGNPPQLGCVDEFAQACALRRSGRLSAAERSRGSRHTGIPNSLPVHPLKRVRTKCGQGELIVRQRIEISFGPTAEARMNGLIYLVGLIVVIMFILSFLGLR